MTPPLLAQKTQCITSQHAACGLPAVVPFSVFTTAVPHPDLQAELLAVALGVIATLTIFLQSGFRIEVMPQPSWWLIAFALYLVVQTAIQHQPYVQMPLLGMLYALYAALMIWLGLQITTSAGTERTATTIASFLFAGALVNSAAGIIQFYGRPALLEDWIALAYGGRARGNVGYINLYANYLSWARLLCRTQGYAASVRLGYCCSVVVSLRKRPVRYTQCVAISNLDYRAWPSSRKGSETFKQSGVPTHLYRLLHFCRDQPACAGCRPLDQQLRSSHYRESGKF
jgi:hypothetical protein